MNTKINIFIFSILFLSIRMSAQTTASIRVFNDTVNVRSLDEIVITATRTERKLGNVAVPVQVIGQPTIRQSGSVRLQDILGEQTGLYITSSGATSSAGGGVFGNGVQLQGLSPDYTLVLIDGEPIIGRQGGVIDLSRVTVGNIKKIEVVKGPSSSLYGSEAMGGVVNIITEQPLHSRLDAGFRYGRFGSMDANLTAAIREEKWGLRLFGNRNSSNGFDLDKTTAGKTVDPFYNYTSQLRLQYQPTARTRLSLSARYFNESQQNYFLTQDLTSGNNIAITGKGVIRDLNLNPVITQKFSEKISSSLRFYFSRYEYEQALENEASKAPYYYDFFRQDFYRAENQTDIRLPADNFISIGGGVVAERLNTTRYEGKRSNDNRYVFLQDEWMANQRLTLIGGLRYDDNTAYRSRLSPKLAARYKFSEKLRVNASYGAGFKAPDFRQLFLNFLNTAAGGYVVYGANEVTISEIERQKREGIINEILPRAYQLAQLDPEISKGWNAGAQYQVNDRLGINLNFFRNDIDNLIQVDIIAYRSNGAPVYSYFNVKKAYTEGGEINATYRLCPSWQFTGGYQYLVTADKDDLRRIKEGSVFTRDIVTNETYKLNRSDYAGLPNRSAHMANAKLFYEDQQKGWSGSFRVIYRSRWGTFDKDGNGLINRDDEFAPGYFQVNCAAAKMIHGFRVQAGIDNLLNYKDQLNLPAQPGIQPYIAIAYSFIKNKNKK